MSESVFGEMMENKKQCRVCKEYVTVAKETWSSGSGTCRVCRKAEVKKSTLKNPESAKNRAKIRQEKQSGSYKLSKEDLAQKMLELKGKCAYCNCELGNKCHQDHIIPVAQGGSNETSNITLTCASCNRNKHAKNLQEYYQYCQKLGYPFRMLLITRIDEMN